MSGKLIVLEGRNDAANTEDLLKAVDEFRLKVAHGRYKAVLCLGLEEGDEGDGWVTTDSIRCGASTYECMGMLQHALHSLMHPEE